MRILLITQYFYPENFKSNDIAFELAKRGHEITVLCGIPNYPEGKYYKGYGILKKRIEKISGVKIYRVAQIPRGNNKILLSLNYLSYSFFASVWVFFMSIFKKYDRIFVHAPSPITQGLPAILMKKIQKIPLYFWVLDIWPDAMKSGGGIKNKRILNMVDCLVKYIYKHSDKILISSKRFTESILSKGNFASKIVYFPNWSLDFSFNESKHQPNLVLPKGFIVLIAGNLGTAQDLKSVLKAALLLKNHKHIKWIFVGDGSMKEWGEQFSRDNELSETVFFYGRYPQNAMPWFYHQANIMLITLRSEFPHLKMVVPARLQSYMSAGKPIVGMIDGGTVDIIEEAKCGKCVPSGDAKGLSQLIFEMQNEPLEEMGKNARNYYKTYFTLEVCINNLCEIMGI
jgi:glycosyltransferase involved in cell wall biosynthesis